MLDCGGASPYVRRTARRKRPQPLPVGRSRGEGREGASRLALRPSSFEQQMRRERPRGASFARLTRPSVQSTGTVRGTFGLPIPAPPTPSLRGASGRACAQRRRGSAGPASFFARGTRLFARAPVRPALNGFSVDAPTGMDVWTAQARAPDGLAARQPNRQRRRPPPVCARKKPKRLGADLPSLRPLAPARCPCFPGPLRLPCTIRTSVVLPQP